MKKIDLKSGRYLIAVSGGPDSMALLDMCHKAGLFIEVAHVNYHKRESALRDEKIVRRYCRSRKIRFHRLNVYEEEVHGNFQQYARQVRYGYFEKLCSRYRLDGVVTAHHEDDLIETYLMQKEKGLGVDYYGLKHETVISGVKVFRPLLGYRKEELIDYCHKNDIEYGIDESNLSDDYARNRIRHHKVEKLDLPKRKKLLEEIEENNVIRQKQYERISPYLSRSSFTFVEFMEIPDLVYLLRQYFPHHSDRHYEEMIRQLNSSKTYRYDEDDLYLVKEYDVISIFNKPDDYCYVFESLKDLKSRKYKYFKIGRRGDDLHGVTLEEKDFPIIIRNHHKSDQIKMRYGTKKINRFFIDNKIPFERRLTYPVMLNRDEEVILVPGIGCDKRHYSHNHDIYVIEL